MSSTSTRRRSIIAASAAFALTIGGAVTVATPSQAAPPPGPPAFKALTLSKTTDLNYVNDTVVVSGAGYTPGTSLFVAVCDSTDPKFVTEGAGCMNNVAFFPVNIDQVKVDAAGKFSKAFKVTGALKLTGTDIRNCAATTTVCKIATTNSGNPADMSSIGFSGPLTFKSAITSPGKAKAFQIAKKQILVTWPGAKSGPSEISKYTVKQRVKQGKRWSKWASAGSANGNRTWYTWKKAKAGKTYQFKVSATNAAQDSATGKASKTLRVK